MRKADPLTNFHKGWLEMKIQVPRKRPEFDLGETMPLVAAAAADDMVEQMYYFVNVVKAENLPAMDKTGSLDPYVEVLSKS